MNTQFSLCYCVEEINALNERVSTYRTLDPFSALGDFLLKATRLHNQYAADASAHSSIHLGNSARNLDPRFWVNMRANFSADERGIENHTVRIYTLTSKDQRVGFDTLSAPYYRSPRYINLITKASKALQQETDGRADIAQILVVFAAHNKKHPFWREMGVL